MKNMEGVKVVGTPNMQRLHNTVAAILSKAHNMDLSVKVLEPDENGVGHEGSPRVIIRRS